MAENKHRMAYNWTMSLEVAKGAESILRGIHQLDGREDWCFAVWLMPEGSSPLPALPSEAHEFLQAAGSSSAMTIAMTNATPQNGDTHSQYTIGKPWHGLESPCEVSVKWNGGGTTVFENEVFTADEAAPIFTHYLEHNTVPAEFELRLIDTNSY